MVPVVAIACAAIAFAGPKPELIQCPATASIATHARLKEARIERSELRCIYDAAVASKSVTLYRPIPADQVCKVGIDGKTVECKPVLGPLARQP